ncbi:MAG: hypothetical protein RLZZ476_1977 [Verrucomicrobiota bacterium]|jgi:hypothetical protein
MKINPQVGPCFAAKRVNVSLRKKSHLAPVSPIMQVWHRIFLQTTALLLAACAFPKVSGEPGPHLIRKKDGTEIVCKGAPVLQEKTGYYRYKTPDNRDAVIHPDQVVSIVKSR